MKIICSKENLVTAINTVQKAVATRTTLPVLEGILFEVDENVKITATDLEIGIEYFIDAEIIEKGSVVINSRILGDIARKLPDEKVSIELNNENNVVKIECVASKFEINGMSPSGYPGLPEIDRSSVFSISGARLKEIIKQTIFAVSIDEKRPILTGSLFEFKNTELDVVSIDGFRLALRREAVSNESGDFSVVVPGKVLNELVKIIDTEDEEISIYQSYSQILFDLKRCRIYSRLLEGEFLNYDNIIPKEFSINVNLNTKQFLYAIERVALLARDDKRYPIRLLVEQDKLIIVANTDIGSAREEIPAETSGSELEIGFNPKYLMDSLKVIDEEKVCIGFTSNVGPCIIKPLEDEGFLHMILPVRLANQN